jgi:hypothetical protein
VAGNTGASEIEQDKETSTDDEPSRPFFYSIDDLPAQSIADFVEEQGFSDEEKQNWFDRFGRDLLTKTILISPNLVVTHESIGPGGKVKPHRHGTHQITYVIKGSLNYGNRKTTAGMGYFSPDMNYSWIAGPEGAEWLEIHAGMPQPYIE